MLKHLPTHQLSPGTPEHIAQVYKDYDLYHTPFGLLGKKRI